jgi:hypothetical protein
MSLYNNPIHKTRAVGAGAGQCTGGKHGLAAAGIREGMVRAPSQCPFVLDNNNQHAEFSLASCTIYVMTIVLSL